MAETERPSKGNKISPDTYAMMIATVGAKFCDFHHGVYAMPIVDMVDDLLAEAGMTVGDYRDYISLS